jgi:hypothetical protein
MTARHYPGPAVRARPESRAESTRWLECVSGSLCLRIGYAKAVLVGVPVFQYQDIRISCIFRLAADDLRRTGPPARCVWVTPQLIMAWPGRYEPSSMATDGENKKARAERVLFTFAAKSSKNQNLEKKSNFLEKKTIEIDIPEFTC